jgi:hypothetical protein
MCGIVFGTEVPRHDVGGTPTLRQEHSLSLAAGQHQVPEDREMDKTPYGTTRERHVDQTPTHSDLWEKTPCWVAIYSPYCEGPYAFLTHGGGTLP